MRSMTGFGQGAAESDRLRATVTLRGVNHRFFDMVLRLRDEYRDVEATLREQIAAQVARGRLEVGVEVELLGARGVEVAVDEEVAQALHTVQEGLVERGLIREEGLAFADLLRLSEVVRIKAGKAEWTSADRDVVLAATTAALEQLVAARSTEGEKLRAVFLPRLASLNELVEQLKARRAVILPELMVNLGQRVRDLLVGEDIAEAVSEDRLAQEIAILIDKSDVSEELDRLVSHVEHFREIMESEGSLGKRLDFLSQEIFRELNTLGSKCRDSEMTRGVLDGKVLCEQLREQVQNVE
jgi:uncharacterized protein (TIGR00255 family)